MNCDLMSIKLKPNMGESIFTERMHNGLRSGRMESILNSEVSCRRLQTNIGAKNVYLELKSK